MNENKISISPEELTALIKDVLQRDRNLRCFMAPDAAEERIIKEFIPRYCNPELCFRS